MDVIETPVSGGNVSETVSQSPQAEPAQIQAEGVTPEASPGEQTTPVETAPVTPAVEVPKEPDLSSGFAALARKEKKLREEAQTLKEYKTIADLKAKKDVAAWLEGGGFTMDDVANHLVKLGSEDTPDSRAEKIAQKKIDEAIAKLREEQSQKESEHKKQQEQIWDAAVTKYKNDIVAHVDANAEKYELIKSYELYDTVFELAKTRSLETGKPADIAQIADEVEEQIYLHEKGKFEKTAKLRKLYTPAETPQEPEPDITPTTKTLTERVKPTPSLNTQNRPMTREQRLAEAAKLIRLT